MIQFSVVVDGADNCIIGAVVDGKTQRYVLARHQGHDDSDTETKSVSAVKNGLLFTKHDETELVLQVSTNLPFSKQQTNKQTAILPENMTNKEAQLRPSPLYECASCEDRKQETQKQAHFHPATHKQKGYCEYLIPH